MEKNELNEQKDNTQENQNNPSEDMEHNISEEAIEEQENSAQEQEAKTAEEPIKELSPEEEMLQLKKEKDELKDKYLRLYAEFDNFKKRTIKEKLDFMKTAAQDTMAALLPVLDDFDRAKKIADDDNTEETFSEGVNLVYQKLQGILSQRGLKAMETEGQDFDPELHEALSEIPAPSEEMKGKIIDTIEKGYLLKDKIIRHAKVVVAK